MMPSAVARGILIAVLYSIVFSVSSGCQTESFTKVQGEFVSSAKVKQLQDEYDKDKTSLSAESIRKDLGEPTRRQTINGDEQWVYQSTGYQQSQNSQVFGLWQRTAYESDAKALVLTFKQPAAGDPEKTLLSRRPEWTYLPDISAAAETAQLNNQPMDVRLEGSGAQARPPG